MVTYRHITKDLYNIKLSILDANVDKNRNELRKLVIKELWGERAGKGKKEKASYYKYYVEQIFDGNRVYITRPARLKLGFDFLIHLENFVFNNGKDNPEHGDIIQDLQLKKREDTEKYNKLVSSINEVFNCKDPSEVLEKYRDLGFEHGFNIDLILKVCKWFFIEQDIRYWNYSGRYMLKDVIDRI
jgi:hypothetical protein